MTEKRNAPCVLVDDLPAYAPPGHAAFRPRNEGIVTGMTFGCPCGCGAHYGARFAGPNAWGFDGNFKSPTVHGSFGCYPTDKQPIGPDGVYHWHGHLTAGEFLEC